jgi:hypothetical protein
LREVNEERDLEGTAPTLIGVHGFEQMNQVIIAHHVRANGTPALARIEPPQGAPTEKRGWH